MAGGRIPLGRRRLRASSPIRYATRLLDTCSAATIDPGEASRGCIGPRHPLVRAATSRQIYSDVGDVSVSVDGAGGSFGRRRPFPLILRSGVTMPALTTKRRASSTLMSRKIRSSRGAITSTPDVGFGVVGTKTLTSPSAGPVLRARRVVGAVTSPTVWTPLRGYSIKHHGLEGPVRAAVEGLYELPRRAVDALDQRDAQRQVVHLLDQAAADDVGAHQADQVDGERP